MSRQTILLLACLGALITPAMADELLDRPMFMQARRPTYRATAIAPRDVTPILTGIVDTRGASRAIFATQDGSQPVPVEVGAQINRWRLASVTPRYAVLERDGRRIVLSPPFSPAGAPQTSGQ